MEDLTDIFRSFAWENLFQIGLILVVAWTIILVSQKFLPWLAEQVPSRYRLYTLALVPIVRLLVIVIAIPLILPRVIEPTFENLVAFMSALGLAIGFALKDYVSSLIAGIVALYEIPYRPGDWIEVEGAYGEVSAMNMRSVEIVTPDDTVVVIPHLKLWDRLIFNSNNGGQSLLCVADFYLAPQHDAATVRHLLYDVALTSVYLQITQPIVVIVLEKPWGTHYRLKAYPIDPRHQFLFITDLTVRGKAAINDFGAQFASAPVMADAAA